MDQPLLTEEEMCRVLRISRDGILRCKRAEDPIPHFKVGRRFLYDLEKVLRWAERQAKRASQDA